MQGWRATRADIDLEAIVRNVQAIRNTLLPCTEIMAVVKADGYGHGAIEVAKCALSVGATRIGVALIEEAIELRRAGIGVPIHVLGVVSSVGCEQVVKFGLTATVVDMEFAKSLSAIATKAGRKANVHVKVDT
ncbi:MAG: alanine racemase, partial [bacterium]|nr:alanine racemase [bacterium]